MSPLLPVIRASAVAVSLAAGLVLSAAALSTAQAACEGERVDGTTADFARAKMQKAGYTQIRELRKGCDSVWHAVAVKNGQQIRLALPPKGEVLEENN